MDEEKIINPQKIYNMQQAAAVLGINEQTLAEYLREGKIVAQKIGEWKILGKSLMDFLSKKTYVIITHQGTSGTVKANNQEELYKKLSTGHYGVLPVHGTNVIPFTPENVKEIVEVVEDSNGVPPMYSQEKQPYSGGQATANDAKTINNKGEGEA